MFLRFGHSLKLNFVCLQVSTREKDQLQKFVADQKEKTFVLFLIFQYLSDFFLLKTSKPYFVAVQVDTQENDHSHENRQFCGGIVIFMAVRGALS